MNDKDIFFLGAGLDKEYEQPLMADFADDLESLYVESPGFLKNHKFLSLLDQRIIKEDELLKTDLDTYYGYVKQFNYEMQQDIEAIIDFAHKHLKDNEKQVFFRLYHYVLFLRELRFYRVKEARLNLYGQLLEKGCNIITTNYTAFPEKEHPKRQEIEQNRPFKLSTTKASYFGVFNKLETPCVLKLHGGVLFYCKDDKISFCFTDEGKEFIPYYEFQKHRDSLGEHIDPRTGWSQLIVPPFKNKDDFLKNNMDKYGFYKNIWKNAKELLKTADRLFIIGYSFNNDDKTVEDLLADAVGDNTEIYLSRGKLNKEKIRNIFAKAKCIKVIPLYAKDFVEAYVNDKDALVKEARELEAPANDN